jgi:hypothetical protein
VGHKRVGGLEKINRVTIRLTPIITQTRLAQTQTLYFHVVFVSGSRVVSKIDNPTLSLEGAGEKK